MSKERFICIKKNQILRVISAIFRATWNNYIEMKLKIVLCYKGKQTIAYLIHADQILLNRKFHFRTWRRWPISWSSLKVWLILILITFSYSTDFLWTVYIEEKEADGNMEEGLLCGGSLALKSPPMEGLLGLRFCIFPEVFKIQALQLDFHSLVRLLI